MVALLSLLVALRAGLGGLGSSSEVVTPPVLGTDASLGLFTDCWLGWELSMVGFFGMGGAGFLELVCDMLLDIEVVETFLSGRDGRSS